MEHGFFSPNSNVPQSESRQLDAMVERQEMPYGYTELSQIPGHEVYHEKKIQNKMKGKK